MKLFDVTCELDAESVNLEEITIDNEGDGHEEKIHVGETNFEEEEKSKVEEGQDRA
ncbi:hypothetical protein SESBI_34689 [Sesbania bispinosa]|nr:hypothetical protein SESBI_34689 [Sesbania bispinosa]